MELVNSSSERSELDCLIKERKELLRKQLEEMGRKNVSRSRTGSSARCSTSKLNEDIANQESNFETFKSRTNFVSFLLDHPLVLPYDSGCKNSGTSKKGPISGKGKHSHEKTTPSYTTRNDQRYSKRNNEDSIEYLIEDLLEELRKRVNNWGCRLINGKPQKPSKEYVDYNYGTSRYKQTIEDLKKAARTSRSGINNDTLSYDDYVSKDHKGVCPCKRVKINNGIFKTIRERLPRQEEQNFIHSAIVRLCKSIDNSKSCIESKLIVEKVYRPRLYRTYVHKHKSRCVQFYKIYSGDSKSCDVLLDSQPVKLLTTFYVNCAVRVKEIRRLVYKFHHFPHVHYVKYNIGKDHGNSFSVLNYHLYRRGKDKHNEYYYEKHGLVDTNCEIVEKDETFTPISTDLDFILSGFIELNGVNSISPTYFLTEHPLEQRH